MFKSFYRRITLRRIKSGETLQCRNAFLSFWLEKAVFCVNSVSFSTGATDTRGGHIKYWSCEIMNTFIFCFSHRSRNIGTFSVLDKYRKCYRKWCSLPGIIGICIVSPFSFFPSWYGEIPPSLIPRETPHPLYEFWTRKEQPTVMVSIEFPAGYVVRMYWVFRILHSVSNRNHSPVKPHPCVYVYVVARFCTLANLLLFYLFQIKSQLRLERAF